MTRYVVAVSGGVDSVVLLDILMSKNKKDNPLTDEIKCRLVLGENFEVIVAHFDHGIRNDSADDAEFVRELASTYGLTYETTREELGKNASEELARDRRYAFLRAVAKKHSATIMTAHHADDVIETIAINLTRGTGWRGLAVLDSPDIERPLLETTKKQLIEYATTHQLHWHEDSTNSDTNYLRNDLRQQLVQIDEQTRELLGSYHRRQVILKKQIYSETMRLIGDSPYARHLFITTPDKAALELLRAVIICETGMNPTRPQLAYALYAVKVFHAGKICEVLAGMTLKFSKTHFVVLQSPKVLS